VAGSEAYLIKVDPATGNAQDAQWIDGAAPAATGITLAGGKVWMTGATPAADVPFSAGVLAPQNLGTGFLAGAYLAAADFSSNVAGAPAIACVLDTGNLTHVRAVAAFQVISLFGMNLGPSTGVTAPDGTDPSIAGVTVTFDGNPAQMIYVSSSQINVAVPAPVSFDTIMKPFTVMRVTVNGVVCCDVVNRGVALYKGKVFVGALDGRLIALDVHSGTPVWSAATTDSAKPYTITSAPRIAKGLVVIGNAGSEYGVRGYISAYDAQTGKMAWRFYTVPGNPAQGLESKAMEAAAKTWAGEWWKTGGGGTVWEGIVYDPALDLLSFGTGNPTAWYRGLRRGRRQSIHRLDSSRACEQRRISVAFPNRARRQLGL
jgi:hypothetical protein